MPFTRGWENHGQHTTDNTRQEGEQGKSTNKSSRTEDQDYIEIVLSPFWSGLDFM